MSKGGKKDVTGHSGKVGKNYVADYVVLIAIVMGVLGMVYGITLKSVYDDAVRIADGFRDRAIAELQRGTTP